MKNDQAWGFLSPFSPGKWISIALLALSVSACGFHLKGMGSNSKPTFKSIYFAQTAGVRADILQTLKQLLKASDVILAQSAQAAALSLSLSATGYEVSRTSLSGQGDTTSELLKMSQSFTVNRVMTETLLLSATVTSFRDRRIDIGAALASSRELKDIQQQMAFDLANQVIDRINRAYQSKQPALEKSESIKASEPSTRTDEQP